MEEGKIIDRLVCGDVGYGKTEVAIRIAMKTVLNNKQVAFLAPTTILSRQHYQTFLNRFQKYGVRVELINRLISKKDQKRIIEDVKKGLVDILIGTHSLLNDSIIYKRKHAMHFHVTMQRYSETVRSTLSTTRPLCLSSLQTERATRIFMTARLLLAI